LPARKRDSSAAFYTTKPKRQRARGIAITHRIVTEERTDEIEVESRKVDTRIRITLATACGSGDVS